MPFKFFTELRHTFIPDGIGSRLTKQRPPFPQTFFSLNPGRKNRVSHLPHLSSKPRGAAGFFNCISI